METGLIKSSNCDFITSNFVKKTFANIVHAIMLPIGRTTHIHDRCTS